MNFILERLKAFAAAFAAGIVPPLVHAAVAAEVTSFGFPISSAWEATVSLFLIGLFVHTVPNKPAVK